MDIYFRQYWKDDRLSFMRQRGIETLSVSTEYLRNMWVPDTFFANEKTAYLHMATTNNEFVRIKYDGQITRSMRYVPWRPRPTRNGPFIGCDGPKKGVR